MNKGFTLIELLAVLMVLAIIALIATPFILNIIRDAKESGEETAKKMYIESVVNTITSRNSLEEFDPQQCQIIGESVTVDEVTYRQGDLLCDGINYLSIKTTGKRPTSGILKLKNGKVIESTINYD